MIFDTRTLQWKGEERTILVQSQNGPCPLIALVNTLVLNGWKSAQSGRTIGGYTSGKDKIELRNILDILGEFIVEQLDARNNAIDGVDVDEDTTAALTYLPHLETGLNVNLRFDGTFQGPELGLFRIFGIKSLHGWICDPEDEHWSIINSVGSYDESQLLLSRYRNEQEQEEQDHMRTPPNGVSDTTANDAAAANPDLQLTATVVSDFLSTYPTQLTAYGIEAVKDQLPEDEAAVLFRNDHFATVVKHNDTLYTLVTDLGFKDTPSVVWHSVTSIGGHEDSFVTSSFNPVSIEEMQRQGNAVKKQTSAENRDFLLARQLQEEEDARAQQRLTRQEQERQKRGQQRQEQAEEGQRRSPQQQERQRRAPQQGQEGTATRSSPAGANATNRKATSSPSTKQSKRSQEKCVVS